jgi:transcriptional regulator with XRE-family HTH domain
VEDDKFQRKLHVMPKQEQTCDAFDAFAQATRQRPGEVLHLLREERGLTLRGVEQRSRVVARKRRNPSFAIPASRLSEIETKGTKPNIFRVYTLSEIYRISVGELLRLYGIPVR